MKEKETLDREKIRQAYKALGWRGHKLESIMRAYDDREINEFVDNLTQVFKDWAYENDYVKREDLPEICTEIASERRSMMQEARE